MDFSTSAVRPLLRENDESSENSDNEVPGSHEIPENSYITHSVAKDAARRNLTKPADRWNFSYLVFYVLGM